jgi:predicted lipoprotein with Yx(FWY)xxD motif
LITLGDPAAGEGVNEDRLSSITREDGSSQVTYNGWPLYYFVADEKPGDANGQDSGGRWFVVTPDGGPVQTNAAVNVFENETLGAILVDASGRTLYLFTNDEPSVSNCSGGCALAWPPLVTVDDPAAGDGVVGGLLGTVTREDGSAQVTHNGRPVYYYAGDEKPGDTNGHEVGGVWFAVSTVEEPADIASAGGGQAVGDDY